MADTHGFEVVAEVTPGMLKSVLQAAWKSGGPGGIGTLVENFNFAGQSFPPFTVETGQVQIPESSLDVAMAPDVNGVALKMELDLQATLTGPTLPASTMVDIPANCTIKAPVGSLPGVVNVGVLLDSPLTNVDVTLVGDPFASHLDELLAQFVHAKYAADGPGFPHTIEQTNNPIVVSGFHAYDVDASVELFDDQMDPARRIDVSRPPGKVRISIPLHLKIHNIQKLISLAPTLLDPMGVTARLVFTADLVLAPGSIKANFAAAVVTVDSIAPYPGVEGTNFTANDSATGGLLQPAIVQQLVDQGTTMAALFGPIDISLPLVSDIEHQMEIIVQGLLTTAGSIAVWTPDDGSGSPVAVVDVATRATADVLIIALNAGAGANVNALGNFVPAGRSFAIAISAAKVLTLIDLSIHMPESAGGLGPGFPPKTFHDVDDHDAELTRLDISLVTGAIHMDGDATVVDAILGSIDVDTSFTEDVGLEWKDGPNNTQRIAAVPGEPDVDLSVLAWILSFLIGFITFGLIGGIIGLVVIAIVEAIAQSIGGPFVENTVTHSVEGIGAWPATLINIGSVDAKFENPIGIGSDGLVLAG